MAANTGLTQPCCLVLGEREWKITMTGSFTHQPPLQIHDTNFFATEKLKTTTKGLTMDFAGWPQTEILSKLYTIVLDTYLLWRKKLCVCVCIQHLGSQHTVLAINVLMALLTLIYGN